MTELPRSEIAAIRIDKDNDIIPISVGLYKLFMASGAPGREAKDLYEHLIFTARLQETRTVRANNTYLARGLSWGIAKVKKAKAWLAEAGLIEYVRARETNGRVAEIYIMLRFLPRAETIAAKLGLSGEVPPADVERAEEEDYREDLTPSLFEEEEYSGAVSAEPSDDAAAPEATTGSEIEPVVTIGSNINPVDNQAYGAERQMLKVKKEMLKVKKEKIVVPLLQTRYPKLNWHELLFEWEKIPGNPKITGGEFRLLNVLAREILVYINGLSPDDVLQAVKNYGIARGHPQSWWNTNPDIVAWFKKHLDRFLPVNFELMTYLTKVSDSGDDYHAKLAAEALAAAAEGS